MIYVNVDTVFGEDWTGEITIVTTRAMGKVLLDAVSDGVQFYSGANEVVPTEEQSEAIEAGTYHISTALNE